VTCKLTTFEFDSVKVNQHAKYTEVTGRLVQEFCPDMKLIALPVPQKMVAKIHPATVASQASWLTTLCKQHEHTHPFNGPLSGTTRVSRYQKGKTNMDFTQARDSEWQWNPLGHMQVCTSLQTDNHPTTQSFTGRMPFLSPNQQRQSIA